MTLLLLKFVYIGVNEIFPFPIVKESHGKPSKFLITTF